MPELELGGRIGESVDCTPLIVLLLFELGGVALSEKAGVGGVRGARRAGERGDIGGGGELGGGGIGEAGVAGEEGTAVAEVEA